MRQAIKKRLLLHGVYSRTITYSGLVFGAVVIDLKTRGRILRRTICESLINRGCFSVVATHLDQLTNLQRLYPSAIASA